jgi:hypothetical protein
MHNVISFSNSLFVYINKLRNKTEMNLKTVIDIDMNWGHFQLSCPNTLYVIKGFILVLYQTSCIDKINLNGIGN